MAPALEWLGSWPWAPTPLPTPCPVGGGGAGLRRPLGVPVAVTVRLQQLGAQGGAERQRVEGRDDRRGGDRQSELLEELPADAGHERRRYEHRAEHERDGNDRAGHFFHRLAAGIARR